MKALSNIITEFKIFTMDNPTNLNSDDIENSNNEIDNTLPNLDTGSNSNDKELETLTTHLRNDFEILLKTFEKQYTDEKNNFINDIENDNNDDFQNTSPDESVNFNNPDDRDNTTSDNLNDEKFDFNF